MIDHVTLNVADVEAAKAFYAEALAPIGYELTMDFVEGAGYAAQGKPDFFLAQRGEPSSPVHVAFRAPTAGASTRSTRPQSPPAGRTMARRGSAASITSTTTARTTTLDPEGNNIEAVTHEPE